MLKPFRCLLHIVIACLLIGGVVIGVECALLNQEQTSRGQLQSSYEEDSAIQVSSSLHHTLKPNATIDGYSATGVAHPISLNSLGLRGDEPQIPKPHGVYRILVLGDESIFAANLAEENTTTGVLQSQIQQFQSDRVEVVNAGVPGYCPLLSLLQFRHQLIGLHPDVVVLHYDLNDASEDQKYRGTLHTDASGVPTSCTHPVLLEGSHCIASGTIAKCAIGRWVMRQLCESSQPIATKANRLWPLSSNSQEQAAVRTSLEPVVELARMAKELSIRFILTATPSSLPQVSDQLTSEEIAQAWQKPRGVLTQFCSESRIEFCDIARQLASSNSKQFYSKQGMTASGHYALASALALQISRSQTSRSEAGSQIQQTSHGG